MITCQTRPADVRLSIGVAATKHMSPLFLPHSSRSLSSPPRDKYRVQRALMTTPLICNFINLNIGPQLLSHTSLQQEELVKYKQNQSDRAYQEQSFLKGDLRCIIELKS